MPPANRPRLTRLNCALFVKGCRLCACSKLHTPVALADLPSAWLRLAHYALSLALALACPSSASPLARHA